MIDLPKILKSAENLDAATRKAEISEYSSKVLFALLKQENSAETKKALISLVIGATADGGKTNEREYLTVYPALVLAFGPEYDYYSIKRAFDGMITAKKIIKESVAEVVNALKLTTEITLEDVIKLFALILTPTLSKMCLKMKFYIARLKLIA